MEKYKEDILDLTTELAAKAHTRGIDMEDIYKELSNQIDKARLRNIEEAIAANKKYVGKYYRQNDNYFKVISNKASSPNRVSVLQFRKEPKFLFNKIGSYNPSSIGLYDLNTFFTDDILTSILQEMEEISEEEFRLAAKAHFNTLLLKENF